MNDQLEADLKDALATRASWVPAQASLRLQDVDYHPRTSRVSRLTIGSLAGVAAASGTAVSVVVLGGAQAAFAGWSASPTPAASGQAATTASDCQSRLASDPAMAAVGTGQWTVVVTDVRGPFTVVIYQDGDSHATCFTGPTFTSVSISRKVGGGQFTMGSASGSGRGSGSMSIVTGNSPEGTSSDGIQTMSVSHLDLANVNGGPYTFVDGQTASDVTGVTLVRSDGEQVRATTGNGWLVAWWPGTEDAASAEISTATGESTQKLSTVSVLPPPGAGPCTSTTQNNSPSSVCSGGGSMSRTAGS